jgi:glutamine amidotransferase
MCELLGISSSRPTDVQAVLHAFQKRGGETADNPDGWGIAFLRDGRFMLHKEPQPAARSHRFVEDAASVHTDLLVAHVRKARLPRVNTLANTHPFLHTCCGREWVFAHNGLVPDVIELVHRDPHPPCTPAGETDSEHAFCHLLENISRHFHEPPAAGVAPWFTALAALSGLISVHGKFNFLISDGAHLIAYGHDRLHYRERRGDGETEEAWIATEPLTAEPWQPFEAGELRIYRRGRLVDRVPASGATASAVVARDHSMNAA